MDKRKALSRLLILLGGVLVLYAAGGRLWGSYKQNQMMESPLLEWAAPEETVLGYAGLEDVFQEAGGAQEAAQAQDRWSIQEEPLLQEAAPALPTGTRMGTIRIPKLKLELPIAEGTDAATLNYFVGHMVGTTYPGEVGNSVVSAHRSHTFGKFFNRLDELESGDTVTVETARGKTTYVVYKKLLVEPDDLSVLKSTDRHKVLTLITCDPMINPTHRLVVHAVER
ncbi:class D sortase [Anaerotalea alkaliphila]|uniref:Class D sortase n=1 Tax=Anaerotalea alkaliphila TaxID=2662126 RepID=A0A7X5HTJ1_9FIRM|nr:class D sortase [Anaerotalea alkaliphila]NDL66369.1 class D sortase [Anaerotalea alkaliphila]